MNPKCKYCGTELAGYETFCPGCGRELPAKGGAGFRPDAETTDDMTAYADNSLFAGEFDEQPVIQRRTAPVRPVQKTADVTQMKSAPRMPVQTKSAPRARTQDAPVRQAQNRPPQARRQNAKASAPLKSGHRRLLLGVMAAAGIVLIVLLGRMISGGEDRAVYPFTPVVDSYFTAVKTGNANTFIETRPPAYTAYLTDGSGSAYGSEPEYRAQMAAQLQNRLADYEAQYGKVKSITYELTDVKRYNHRSEALSGVLSGWYGFPEQAVTDAYIVSGSYTVHGADGAGDYAIDELLLVYMNENWYFSPDAGSYWRAE